MNNENQNQNLNMEGSLNGNEVLGSIGSAPSPSVDNSSVSMNMGESLNGSVDASSPSVNPVAGQSINPVAPPVIPSMEIVEPPVTPVNNVESTPVVESVVSSPSTVMNPTDNTVISSTVSVPEGMPVNPVDTTVISSEPANTFNLQPEGVVPPVSQEPVAPVNGPLMGMSLTGNTVVNPTEPSVNPVPGNGLDFNANSVPNFNSSGNSIDMGMNPQGGSVVPPTSIDNNLMGGVPLPPEMPSGDSNKKKAKISMPVLIVLIVVLIAGVGFGLYYVLVLSKSKTSAVVITPVLKEVELGSNILNVAASYATVSGMSIANCTVESNLDANKTGTYEYSITCGSVTSKGNKVIVTDTVAPVVALKEVVIYPNTALLPEDFVASISDASEYTIEFENELDTLEEGEFEVGIIVKDAYGNETNVVGKLIVTEDAPQYYLSCESTHESTTYSNAQIQKVYKYGISLMGELYNTREVISYTFLNEDEYQAAVDTIDENKFDGLEGLITTDDDIYVIYVTKNLKVEDLSQEFTVNPFPTLELEIEAVHTERNEICSLTID